MPRVRGGGVGRVEELEKSETARAGRLALDFGMLGKLCARTIAFDTV